MKKYFVVAIAVMAVLAVAMPASAKVEFSYGGLFRARILSEGDFTTPPTAVAVGGQLPAWGAGTAVVPTYFDQFDENTRNRLDNRTRLYFTFTASENLRLHSRFEFNEVWGDVTTSGRVGADSPNDFWVKQAYIDFNIPNGLMPINAKVGVQGIDIFNQWVIADDFAAAVITAKMDPFKLTMGYIGAQNNDQFNEKENVDDFMTVIDYVCGPWSASLGTVIQFGHDTFASADPSTVMVNTPFNDLWGSFVPNTSNNGPRTGAIGSLTTSFTNQGARNFFQRYFMNSFPAIGVVGNPVHHITASDNNLIDLALNVNYKNDFLSAYLNFVKNFGKIHIQAFTDNLEAGPSVGYDYDYEGWMIDLGGSYFCGPFTFNLGGFYTSGPEDIEDSLWTVNRVGKRTGDIDWFTYPMGTAKYFSEILGGGILDPVAPKHEDLQWKGYPYPSNLWTVNAGAAWQVLPSTKLTFSYWYFGTSEDVVSGYRLPAGTTYNQFLNLYMNGLTPANLLQFDSEIGHEFNVGISHKIVDGLMLDLVGAYLISGDAYSMRNDDLDAIELGARLQWTF